MDNNLYRFILRYSVKEQVVILLITLSSFPFLYYSLDLPKIIVNQAIAGKHIPTAVFGFPVTQIQYLLYLSLIFLVLVFINGWFKYNINTRKGQLGERMLRRMRYELYERVLRFPLPQFRRMSQGEIIPMITSEVEPLGGFIGDAFAQPITQGGTLLVYIAFIFIQDPVLGTAAVSLYPIQGYIIPRLQKRVNQLGKLRVRTIRQLSDRISESASGVLEIHANDASGYHLADFSHRLGDIFDIRFEIYQRKFFIKFLNNFINQLTPFFFYAIGGYLVIHGNLSFGALVAVLAAYKDLAAPWKELLDYYQQTQDIRIKYEQVIEQFQPPDLWDEELILADPEGDGRLTGTMQLTNVVFGEGGSAKVIDGVTAAIPLDQHTAIVGGSGSGKEDLAMLIARLVRPTSGRILVGEQDLERLPESVTGRRIAYVGPAAYVFTGSLRDNFLYGLRHRPLRPPERDAAAQALVARRMRESTASGNSTYDVAADWVDYGAVGCDGPDGLAQRAVEMLAVVDLENDVYNIGLNGTIDPAKRPDVAARILEARNAVREQVQDPALSTLVERFDPLRFNTNATVAENMLFGTPVGPTFATDRLAEHPYVLQVLDKVGLTDRFLETGSKVAETMLELFADLPPGHEFFEQFSFISSEELPAFQALVQRVKKEGMAALKPEDRSRLMALPFKLIVARHRLDLIDEAMQAHILEARHVFAADLPEHLRTAVELFEEGEYNSAATIQDNILFGKLAYGQAQVATKVGALLVKVVDDLALRDVVVAVGLDHPVGVGGSRLSIVQRQKTALARALLKNPDLLVISEATAAFDGASQAKVHTAILERRRGQGIVWVLHRPSMARQFDQTLVLRAGKLVESGQFAELDKPGTALHELLKSE